MLCISIGISSRSTNLRTVSRSRRMSSGSSKSMQVPPKEIRPRDQSTNSNARMSMHIEHATFACDNAIPACENARDNDAALNCEKPDRGELDAIVSQFSYAAGFVLRSCFPVGRHPRCFAAPGRSRCRFLPRQDRQHPDRGQCRRRLRHGSAADRPLHRQAHPWQSDCGAAEHDRRGRHQDGQLSLCRRAAGWHRDRHVSQYARCRAGGWHRRRAIRRQPFLLARLDEHQSDDVRGLAYHRRAHAWRMLAARR